MKVGFEWAWDTGELRLGIGAIITTYGFCLNVGFLIVSFYLEKLD